MKTKKWITGIVSLLTVGMLALCALSCGEGGLVAGGDTPATANDFFKLELGIDAAKEVLADLAPSVIGDGSDVDDDKYFVSVEVYDALVLAIGQAEELFFAASGTKSAVDAMIATLIRAVIEAEDEKSVEFGTFTGRADLRALVAKAGGLLEAAVVAEGAAEVDRGDTFVLQADFAALEAALEEIEEVDTQDIDAVNAAVETLSGAILAFESSEQVGTMPPDLTSLNAAITVAAGKATSYTVDGSSTPYIREPEVNNVPGLFIDFGHYWVPKKAADDFDAAKAAAAAFVANIATVGTKSDAAIQVGALESATTAYDAALPAKEGLGLVFVEVPAGRFMRYAGTATLSTTSYETRITNAYKIGKYEVTVGQWEAVMGTDWPSGDKYDAHRTTSTTSSFSAAAGDNGKFPATRITHADAIAFSNKLSTLVGRTRVYTVSGITTDDAWKEVTASTVTTNRASGWAGNSGPQESNIGNFASATQTLTNNGFRLPSGHEWQWAAMGAYADTSTAFTEDTGVTMMGTSETRINAAGYKKAYAGQAASAVSNAGTASRTSLTRYANVYWPSSGTDNPGNTGSASSIYVNGASVSRNVGTIRVGRLLPNELGIHDMTGNAFEWCFDWADGGNNLALPATTNPQTDYFNTTKPSTSANQRRLGHGGDWFNPASNVSHAAGNRPSIWNRTGYYGHIGYDQSGFRLVTRGENPSKPVQTP